MSKQTYMTRNDEGVGEGPFDSIAWIFETHIKQPDTREFNYALFYGWHEDSPIRIELWREEPKYAHNTRPDMVWIPPQE